MTEEYLHFVWKNKRILKPQLTLTDGSSFSILNFGIHNQLLKGPDFNYGAIEMDGLKFHGPIELHVKSSDWYLHKHHLDSNYDNVILHVVYEHDKEVIQNGRKLPVLELKSLINPEHWKKHKSYSKNSNRIICENELKHIDPVYLQSMMGKALVQKLNDKVELVKSYLNDDSSPFYFFLAAAFGANINKDAFLELVRKVPESQIRPLIPSQRYKLLVAESGMYANHQSGEQWHFKGTRPKNFPTVRLKQFTHLIGGLEFQGLLSQESIAESVARLVEAIDVFNNSSFGKESAISAAFKNNILINGFVPYLWFLSIQNEDERFQEEALLLLAKLQPEQNGILKKWKKTGVSIGSAYESQGLLALYRYNCCRKKCLSCAVGNSVLNTK